MFYGLIRPELTELSSYYGEGKGVTMRGIFSNPACQKFKHSF